MPGNASFTTDDYKLLAEKLRLSSGDSSLTYEVSCDESNADITAAVARLNKAFNLAINLHETSYLSHAQLHSLRRWFYQSLFQDHPVITKTMVHKFTLGFLENTMQIGGDNSHVVNLRVWKKQRWTVFGDRVEARRRKPPLYTEEEKSGFSKSQSTCYVDPNAMFPVYASSWPGAAGFIFPSGSYLLSRRLYVNDSMTTNRSYDHRNRDNAVCDFKNQCRGPFSPYSDQRMMFADANKYAAFLSQKAINGNLYQGPQGTRKEMIDSIKKHDGVVRRSHTDALTRLKITDETLIGIFNDSLSARAFAMFLAERVYLRKIKQQKIHKNDVKPPEIVYYCQDSLRVLTPYSDEQRRKDLESINDIFLNGDFRENLDLMLAFPDIDALRSRLLQFTTYNNVSRLSLIWFLVLKKKCNGPTHPPIKLVELLACRAGLFDDIDKLLLCFTDLDITNVKSVLQSAFPKIVGAGCVNLTRALLKLNRTKPFLDNCDDTILHEAVSSGNQELVELLLDYPDYVFDRNSRNILKRNPLQWALNHRMPMAFRRLLDDPHLEIKKEGPSILLDAVNEGAKAYVQTILEKGIEPDAIPIERVAPLFWNAKNPDYFREGYTALMYAAKNDECEIAALLLRFNASLTTTAPDGENTLTLAVEARSFDTLKLLLEQPNSQWFIENSKQDVVKDAWKKHHRDDIVELLLQHGFPDTVGYRKNQEDVKSVIKKIADYRHAKDSIFACLYQKKADLIEAALTDVMCAQTSTVTAELNKPNSRLSIALSNSLPSIGFFSLANKAYSQPQTFLHLDDPVFTTKTEKKSYQSYP